MTIRTPDIPPLWGFLPDPPVDPWVGDPIPEPFPQRPPLGPPLLQRAPNSRHPLTGAPTWRPELGDQPLPPFQRYEVTPNARHPVTGALLYFRSGEVIPPGWEI